MPDAGIAPACRATSWPALKRTNVGIAWMRKRCARTGSLSVLTLATSQRPAPSPATRASSGATILQGPHQGAQKSAKTGKAERPTRLSKAASWLSSTGSPGGGSSWWQWPQRNVPPSRSKFMRLRVPQCAQLSSNPRSSVSIVSVAVFIKTSHLRSELIHVVPKVNRDTRPSFSRAFLVDSYTRGHPVDRRERHLVASRSHRGHGSCASGSTLSRRSTPPVADLRPRLQPPRLPPPRRVCVRGLRLRVDPLDRAASRAPFPRRPGKVRQRRTARLR